MSHITKSRIRAEKAVSDYTRRNARAIITAELVNESGGTSPVVTARPDHLWIRLHSDPNQLAQALRTTAVEPIEGLIVEVEYVQVAGYVIRGLATRINYPANPWMGMVPSHASQHLRLDFGQGGHDPVDVDVRMFWNLRASQQSTPDMTVYVMYGKWDYAGTIMFFVGGTSPTIIAPTSVNERRCDLLYLNSSNALAVVTGTPEVLLYSLPTRPAMPAAGGLPIAFLYSYYGQTTITEEEIEDARLAFGASGAGAITPHAIDGAQHTVAGRTAGQLLRATAATTFGWSTATYPDTAAKGGLVVATDANVIGALAVGLTTQVLVGGGAATVPAWSTDLPTALTIGSAYVYRAGGTDVAVADGGTNLSSYAIGDILYASAATTIAKLAVSVPAATFMNYVGLANGDTVPGYKALFDATVPTTIAESAAAAAGTATPAARRDHTHGAPATWAATAHAIDGAKHTIVGAALSLVGATTLNTLGLITPSSDVSAGTSAILVSNAGELILGKLSVADGTIAAPTLTFKNDTTVGLYLYSSVNHFMGFVSNNKVLAMLGGSNGWRYDFETHLDWFDGDLLTGNLDLIVWRGGPRNLGLKLAGTKASPQPMIFTLENFYDAGGVNRETGFLGWESNVFKIKTTALGTGVVEPISIEGSVILPGFAANRIPYYDTSGYITASGNFRYFSASNYAQISGSPDALVGLTLYNTNDSGTNVYTSLQMIAAKSAGAYHSFSFQFYGFSNTATAAGINLAKRAVLACDSTVGGLILSTSGSASAIDFLVNGNSMFRATKDYVSVGTLQTATGVTYQKLTVLGSMLLSGISTVQERELGTFVPSFVVNTDASYTGRVVGNVYDKAGAREFIRGEASGSAAMLSFFGVNAVVRPTALTAALTTITCSAPGTPDYAIADLVQNTGYGFVSADEGQSTLKVVANLQTRVGEIETKLVSLGLLT